MLAAAAGLPLGHFERRPRSGLTVRGALAPERVTYDAHGWPDGYSYTWPTLRRSGSITGTHPKVYVAFGSHAAYPVRCRRPPRLFGNCDQLDDPIGPAAKCQTDSGCRYLHPERFTAGSQQELERAIRRE